MPVCQPDPDLTCPAPAVCAASGLAYEDQGRYAEAVAQFRNFSSTVRVHPLDQAAEITFSSSSSAGLGQAGGQGQGDLLLEGKVRECDLLQLLDQVQSTRLTAGCICVCVCVRNMCVLC